MTFLEVGIPEFEFEDEFDYNLCSETCLEYNKFVGFGPLAFRDTITLVINLVMYHIFIKNLTLHNLT